MPQNASIKTPLANSGEPAAGILNINTNLSVNSPNQEINLSSLQKIRNPEFFKKNVEEFKKSHPNDWRTYSLVLEKNLHMASIELLKKGATLPFSERRTPEQLQQSIISRMKFIDKQLVLMGYSADSVNSLSKSLNITVKDYLSLPGMLGNKEDLIINRLGSNVSKLKLQAKEPELFLDDSRGVQVWSMSTRNSRTGSQLSSRSGSRNNRNSSETDQQYVIPRTMEKAAQWYKQKVLSMGGKWDDGVNQINIVAIRGRAVSGERHSNNTVGKKVYDDTIAFIWKDRAGKMNVFEFQGTTDPTQVKGIGTGARLGVPQIKAGQQLSMEIGRHKGRADMGIVLGQYDATRYFDRNGDGLLSPKEGKSGQAAATNLHDLFTSAGCFVFPMDNATYKKYVAPKIKVDADGKFKMTVLDLSVR